MHSLNGRRESRPTMTRPTRRGLVRLCRMALYRAAAEDWQGTRSGLRRRIRELIKPMRARFAWMLRVVREARFAALVAGAVLATGLAGTATAAPIELSDITAGTGGFAMNGEVAGDQSGNSVSAAGDVNGDGLADLIVGARHADPNGSSSGRSYVVFGKADGTLQEFSNVTAGIGGFSINGEAGGDYSGRSVSAAGDVNGDGLADLIVGAPRADPNGTFSGRSYVVFGKATGTVVQLSDVTAGTGGFAINGEAAFDVSGTSVSSAGDVDGDGLADLIVGARDADPNGSDSGRSYVVFGKTGTAAVNLSAITAGTGGFVMNGEAADDKSGRSVSAVGDVNGDGLADLIVGARRADPNGARSGRSYVVFSPELAATSGTYKMTTVAGDGAGGDIVPETELPPGLGDVVRVSIDYSDEDSATGAGPNGASTETVVLTRSKSSITNLTPVGDVANVLWEITTDRTGFADAEVTLKYLDSEIAGVNGTETNLEIFTAPDPAGPWTLQPTTIDASRNEASTTVTGFSFFALATVSSNSAREWLHYE